MRFLETIITAVFHLKHNSLKFKLKIEGHRYDWVPMMLKTFYYFIFVISSRFIKKEEPIYHFKHQLQEKEK